MGARRSVASSVAAALVVAALLIGCGSDASTVGGGITRETHVYKISDGHRISADIYRQPGQEAGPAIMWLHPGALIVGSREWLAAEQLEAYIEGGYRVIAVDYRLAPETRLADIVEDVEDAYHWVRSEGPELFQIDPNRIALVGHSAGAYLALTVGQRVEPQPRAIVAFYGYGDITGDWITEPSASYLERPVVSEEQAYAAIGETPLSSTTQDQTDERYHLYIHARQHGTWPLVVSGHDPSADPGWFSEYEPLENLTATYPPTMLLHGEADTDVPIAQSQRLADELARLGVEHEMVSEPAWGHMFDAADWDKPAVEEAFLRVLTFLDKHTE